MSKYFEIKQNTSNFKIIPDVDITSARVHKRAMVGEEWIEFCK
jgi:hypothetical protein